MMEPTSKQWWLDVAEVMDALRLIPRLVLAITIMSYLTYCYWITMWWTELLNPSNVQTALPAITVPALGGVVTAVINRYMVTGRKWGNGSNTGPAQE